MLRLLRMQQSPATLHQFDDGRVRFPHPLAGVFRQAVAQDAFFVDIAGRVESILHAGDEIFRTMRWRRVDYARSRVHRDVIGEHAQDFPIQKWMLEIQPLHLSSREVREFARIGEAALFGRIFCQLRSDDVHFATRFQRYVLFIRMKRDRHRRRQRPRSGRPDDGRRFLSRQCRVYSSRIVEQGILHPDR